jgi:hypothetical protein
VTIQTLTLPDALAKAQEMQQGNLIETHEQAGDFGNGKKRRAIRG